MRKRLLLLFLLIFTSSIWSQEMELYTQFNGNFDYTAIGNTLNLEENENAQNCNILTSSSAMLSLDPGQQVEAAYIYWAGSGSGDFDILVNNQPVSSQREFSLLVNNLDFFAAFSDVTSIVQSEGNGAYTISDLDLLDFINPLHCNDGVNYGGWSIIIVYEDLSLPSNQINLYDGFELVGTYQNNSLEFQLDNLNVIDTQGAKIGFLAWEGDASLADGEQLKLNGNVLSNALNPPDNAFNGTNSFTGATDLYNMDLDVYEVENYINIGDTSATIELTSFADYVMVNSVVTVFNSILPDPAVNINDFTTTCNSKEISIDYTIDNFNGTDVLPSGTSVTFFADDQLLEEVFTPNDLVPGASESFQIDLAIPNSIPNNFNLEIKVNLDSQENTIISEIDPSNNITSMFINLGDVFIASPPLDMEVCDGVSNDGVEIFDFSENTNLAIGDQQNVTATYYTSFSNAENDIDPITSPNNYPNTENPQEVFIKIQSSTDPDCFVIASFFLRVYKTPIAGIPEELFSCDMGELDGISLFDLTENTSLISNNQQDVGIDYYLNQADAENGMNPISNPSSFENINNPQTIYAVIYNSNYEACYDLVSFQLSVKEIPLTEIEGDLKCDTGFNTNDFDLSEVTQQIDLSLDEEITGYFLSFTDANSFENPINAPFSYQNTENPQRIFVRVDSNQLGVCQHIHFFDISTQHCEPFIPEGFSPNGDGINDSFFITGLYDIFENFELQIFNRYGTLIYKGNNKVEAWDGTSNKGLNNVGKGLPTGTYFYILDLKDPKFGPYKGWVYLNR
ncbi:MAG: gliding motility-associated C-terminal domain-containing protein [Mesonia sp.]|uniref:T9SS type B sorting domain-containing protein n=2 Tax=Mesonia sp. TaxID=1960830 RepID=UPI003F9E5437